MIVQQDMLAHLEHILRMMHTSVLRVTFVKLERNLPTLRNAPLVLTILLEEEPLHQIVLTAHRAISVLLVQLHQLTSAHLATIALLVPNTNSNIHALKANINHYGARLQLQLVLNARPVTIVNKERIIL